MIPAIGLMIGAYIFTRMLELIINKQTHGAVVMCSFITILIVGLSTFDLIVTGISAVKDFKGMPSIPEQMR